VKFTVSMEFLEHCPPIPTDPIGPSFMQYTNFNP